jgi:RNA polymerase sigma-70 factor (ECF subfamily)
MGATREQAEDAAQNAVLRAWRHRRRLRPGSDPAPWVRAIARNELLRLWARAHNRSELATAEPGAAGGECDAIDAVADRLDLRAALRQLDDHERLLLGLRYGRDLTQREVAEVLGLPEGTAKVRLHRARDKIRTLLGQDA